MTKQLEVLIASEIADFFATVVEIHTEIGGPNTVEEAQQQLTERVTRIASECEASLIAALELAQQRVDDEICRANREHHRGFMMACRHLEEHANVHYADAAEVEIAALRNRIAELEASETQLIEERDNAEEALADMYQAATGERPEWSNWFSFADAVDAVEQRLGELEAIPLAVKLPPRIVDIQLRNPLEVKDIWIARFTQALNVADRLQDSAFRHGLQHGFSYGQTNDQSGFEQAMRAYGNIRAYKRDDVIEAFRVAGGSEEGE